MKRGPKPRSATPEIDPNALPQNVMVWKPNSENQERFLRTAAYECLFGGTKGPGKTEMLLLDAASYQTSNPAFRALILRRTFPRLGEIIDRSFKYYPKFNARYSSKDQQLGLPAWTWPSGAKVAFAHCQHEQDKYNFQGKEFHSIYFDQVEEFTETQYLFIMAQNRTSNKTIKCYIRATANPGGVGHAWVKKRFIEPLTPNVKKWFKRVDDDDIEVPASDPSGISRIFIPASVYENPAIMDNDPNYVKRLEQLPESDKQALLYGNWNVFKGQFFNMWRNSLHVQERDVHPSFRKFLSLDYGYGAPSSVGWWQIDFQGRLHRYRELYKERLTYEELARRIMELTPDNERMDYLVADPAIWGDKSHHKDGVKGESGAETMAQVFGDFTSLVKADNDRVIGWGRLRIMLQNNQISCSARCKDSIRTIPTLIHDEVKVEDLDTTGEDHNADEWRYAVMSRIVKSFIPTEQSEHKSLEWWKRFEANIMKPFKKKESWEGLCRI